VKIRKNSMNTDSLEKVIIEKLMVLSFSRSQRCFHTESAEGYIKGSLVDLNNDTIIGCDYRAIGFYFTSEQLEKLYEQYENLEFKVIDHEVLEKHRELKIW
jgi:hypothetical protein